MFEKIKEKIGDNGVKIIPLSILLLFFVVLILSGPMFLKKPREKGVPKTTIEEKNGEIETAEEKCQKMDREEEKNDCFDELKTDVAIRQNNIKNCVEIKSVEMRDDCIKILASHADFINEKLCLSISDVAKKELCLLRVIITKKELGLCEIYFKDNFLKKSECRNGISSSESGNMEESEKEPDSFDKEKSNLDDTDKDGLFDLDEIFYGTDRFKKDTDGDGASDKQEVDNLTNPLGAGDMDFDGDGITDKDEEKYKTNPSLADSDGDGLSDYDEIFKYKTDPNIKDTDKDGYSDGDEVKNGYNPLGEGKLK